MSISHADAHATTMKYCHLMGYVRDYNSGKKNIDKVQYGDLKAVDIDVLRVRMVEKGIIEAPVRVRARAAPVAPVAPAPVAPAPVAPAPVAPAPARNAEIHAEIAALSAQLAALCQQL